MANREIKRQKKCLRKITKIGYAYKKFQKSIKSILANILIEIAILMYSFF